MNYMDGDYLLGSVNSGGTIIFIINYNIIFNVNI